MRLLWLILHLLGPRTDSHTEAAMTDLLVIRDHTPREDIIEALGHLNNTAKMLRRKGHTGTASVEYARQHARIDALLTELVPCAE